MNVALDVVGVEEMFAPPSAAAGKLFARADSYNPLDFQRVSGRGFSTRVRQFEIFRETPIHEDFSIPSELQVMEAIFLERGYSIKRTNISAVMDQLGLLMGGYGNLGVLASASSLRLINRLAPRRTQRIVDEIRSSGVNLTGAVERELAERLTEVPSLNQPLTQTLGQLEDSLQIKKAEKYEFHSLVQELYNRGLLLRGKNVRCSHCLSILWFPLEVLSRPLRCYCCNAATDLPVAPSTEADDSYRLNELLVKAVDQGLLAMLLTMRVLWEQSFFSKRLLPSVEVCEEGCKDTLLEVDIAFTLGADMGLCEVKSDQEFDLVQADELVAFAEALGVNMVVFSTLKPDTDRTVVAIAEHMDERKVQVPIMLLTRKTLLATNVPQLSEFYKRQYLAGSKSVFVL